MIDFHSHILPALDDGSQSVEESIALLGMLSEQGIRTVVATPHFYAKNESPDGFSARRAEAFEKLKGSLGRDCPEIILGAEVAYYPGIARRKDISKLCIGESELLLLEMPMTRWHEMTLKELEELASLPRLTVAIAHAERCLGLQGPKAIARIRERGILIQCNADRLLSFGSKRRTLASLSRGEIHLIGSDCHNLTFRPPQIGRAYSLIKEKLGEGFYSQLCEFGYSLLNKRP